MKYIGYSVEEKGNWRDGYLHKAIEVVKLSDTSQLKDEFCILGSFAKQRGRLKLRARAKKGENDASTLHQTAHVTTQHNAR